MRRIAVIMIGLAILSKTIGFFREIILSYYYGTSALSDTFVIALTIPTVLFGFIITGFSTTFIPMYTRIINDEGRQSGLKYLNNLVNIVLIISTFVFCISFIFMEQIVGILSSSLPKEIIGFTIKYCRISLVIVYTTAITGLFSAFLQANQSFVISSIIYLPMNFILIITLVLGYYNDMIISAYGIVLAYLSQMVLLIPYVYKYGYRYRLSIGLKNQYIRETYFIIMPVILSSAVYHINIIIDRALAGKAMIGGVSALNYANVVNGFVQGVFIVPIITALYPLISKNIIEGNYHDFKNHFREASNLINIFVMPSMFLLIFYNDEVIRLLFGRGAFDQTSIEITSNALMYYAIGFIAFGYKEILNRTFYSMQDTRTPLINSFFAVSTNIILSLELSKHMGIDGIALATSISAVLSTLLLRNSLRKKTSFMQAIFFNKDTFKILIVTCCFIFLCEILFKYNEFKSDNLSFIFSVIVSSCIYIILIASIKITGFEKINEKILMQISNLRRRK